MIAATLGWLVWKGRGKPPNERFWADDATSLHERKITRSEFRIAFARAAAFIGLRIARFPMSDQPQDTASPLAEISHGPSAFEMFLDRNQKLLVITAIVGVLGVTAWIIRESLIRNEEETAGAALVKATDLAGYQKIISTEAETKAAGSAAVLAAAEQWKSGQQEAAITSLRSFVSSHPDHPAVSAAKASLASKLMLQGKNEEAAREFQGIADDPQSSYLGAYALVSQADMALAAGDADKAETLYKKSLADFPDSPFSQTASQRIASLRAKPPVEIDPPPAPATPPPSASPSLPGLVPGTVLPNGLKIEEVKEEPVAPSEVSPSQTPDKP